MAFKKRSKLFLLVLVIIILAAGIFSARYLWFVYSPNVSHAEKEGFLYIRSGAGFEEVVDSLMHHGWLKNEQAFRWVAARARYIEHIKSGRYLVTDGMSTKALVNRLRSGQQSPVKLTFNNIRTKKQLASRISRQLEADSVQLLTILQDPSVPKEFGFTQENFMCMFIPNTYEVYWNVPPEKFMNRMHQEYQRFWNDERKQKAKKAGLSLPEVSVLASIVEMESTKEDEKPGIAGVYLNRLKRGMRLEADPTLVFALGDFSIQRVLNKDRLLDSPYNTYMYRGLPPGPITLPSIRSLDAVLNPTQHNHIFFCARADMSGYHNFSPTLAQHMRHARAYQQALNQRNIKR